MQEFQISNSVDQTIFNFENVLGLYLNEKNLENNSIKMEILKK